MDNFLKTDNKLLCDPLILAGYPKKEMKSVYLKDT